MKRLLLIAAFAAAGRLCAQDLTEYRWWVNDDPATLVNTPIAATADVQVSTALDLPALTRDYNTITVQFKDSDGRYSVPFTTWYSKGTGAVNGYEYWIDDAITSSSTGAIGPNTVVDLIADLPTGTTNGAHVFTIRFSSVNGTWTVPLTTEFSFFNRVDELPGISDLLLFPNPVTDELGLRLNTDATRSLKLEVLGIDGAVVRDLANWSVNGSTYRTWDISDLAPGTYLLRLSDGNGTRNLPFVKP